MVSQELADRLLNPSPENAQKFLADLGFDRLPTREEINEKIQQKFLTPKESLPEHWLPTYQTHWDHSISIPSLLSLSPSPPTTVSFRRAGLDGKIIGYVEVPATKLPSALASTSLSRAPAPSKNFVRGKAGYMPFWPGGLDPVLDDQNDKPSLETKGGNDLRTIPPGFSRGLRLPGDEDIDEDLGNIEATTSRRDISRQPEDRPVDIFAFDPLSGGIESEIDSLLPLSKDLLRPPVSVKPTRRPKVQKRDWAHVVDINQPMTNFRELVPELAHKYPFELDIFQKQAVYHLERGDSVFVAAHTSAGKTVVAEYAIALAVKHMTRAIYTSPIKALSNQKFRDFKTTFSSSSVGILTGDVQINPEASCLVMTTEILRSMLYKGADLIRDVEFVIFDEVHYVNDAERGVVWEEVIIMLPEHVNIILLSATVPNTKEFADWVGRTKKKDIYVVSTPKRPVPLEHFLYAGRDIFKILDASGNFVSDGHKEAGEAIRRKQDKEREAAGLPPVTRLGARAAAPQRGAQQQRGSGQRGVRGSSGSSAPRAGGSARTHYSLDKNLYVHLLGLLRKKELLPAVVFTFSKKKCEEQASTLTNADLCTSVEKSEVHVAVEKALSRLKGSDKNLPQIGRMRDFLSRGIGVHHGGLLPIVKEVVEILFARGLVKILFATETFAMGVNMPARCVVFSGIRKHDGRSFRDLLTGEYTQMSGRAGRRGLDATGVVIIVAGDVLPDTDTLRKLMLGTPNKLQSQFRLTYNMILNLLRVETLRVEEMIKRSFSENASQKLLPDQQKLVFQREMMLKSLPQFDCSICLPDIKTYYSLSKEVVWRTQDIIQMAVSHTHGIKSFANGRVVILRDAHFRSNVAILCKPVQSQSNSGVIDRARYYWVLALVDSKSKGKAKEIDVKKLPPLWPISPASLRVTDPTYEAMVVPLSSVALVTSRTLKTDVSIPDHPFIPAMEATAKDLATLVQEWSQAGQVPELEWPKLRTMEFQEAWHSRTAVAQRIDQNRGCLLCDHFEEHYARIHQERCILEDVADLKLAVSDQNLQLLPDYEQRIDVLKHLKFIDENSTVLLKGRVACEINSANELVLTELILENTLASFNPEEVVALLSCFVFQEKTDIEPSIPPKLVEGRDAIIAIADRIGIIQNSCKVSAADFGTQLKFGLAQVVYEWAKGMPFEQITPLTDVAEGTIVRVITRLDETCREVRDAARVIGDADLFKKMEEAQIKIKRDIVFAASLYF